MASLCDNCKKEVSADGLPACYLCKKIYHFECSSVKESTWRRYGPEKRAVWRCQPCRSDSRSEASEDGFTKGGGDTEDEDVNANAQTDVKMSLANIFKQLQVLSNEMRDIKSNTTFMSEQYDDLLIEMQNVTKVNKELQKKIELLEADNRTLKEEVHAQRKQTNDIEQYGRRNNLEIHGIEETSEENVLEIVQVVAKQLHLELEPAEIEAAHRIKSSKKAKPKPTLTKQNPSRPAPIIVRFVNRATRDTWMEKRKTGLSSSNVVGGTNPSKVYLSENLTYSNRHLAFLARQAGRNLEFKFVWTKNGNVFMKKTEQSATIRIKNEMDIPQK